MPDVRAAVDAAARPCGTCRKPCVQADFKGEPIRVSAEPEGSGNLALAVVAEGRLQAGLLTRGRAAGMVAAGQPVYLHHALTCTAPRDWLRGPMPTRKFAAR